MKESPRSADVSLARNWTLSEASALWLTDKGELGLVSHGVMFTVCLARDVQEQREVVPALASALRDLTQLPAPTAPTAASGWWGRARTLIVNERLWLLQTTEALRLVEQGPTLSNVHCVALGADAERAFANAVFELEAELGAVGGKEGAR
jgi:hypothetical protein